MVRKLIKDRKAEQLIEVDSAGTGAWHVGDLPDSRARQTARTRGISLDSLRARQITKADFDDFDTIVAMDQSNYRNLFALGGAVHRHKIHLMMDFVPSSPIRDIPDPYYGGDTGFEDVFDMIEQAGTGLLDHILNPSTS